MPKKPLPVSEKTGLTASKKDIPATELLTQQGFDYSIPASFIVMGGTGKIIVVNRAAEKFSGISKKILLTKNIADILGISKSKFIRSAADGKANKPYISAIKTTKNKAVTCEVNYAFFKDEQSAGYVIVSIADISERLLTQLNIDTKKDKIVSDNIILARSKQKNIDHQNKKTVADNIDIAKSKQRKIDIKKERIVSDNIILAQEKYAGEKLDYENIGRIKVLSEIEANFRIMFNSSSDVLFDSDLMEDSIMVNESYEREFGYTDKEDTVRAIDWSKHIHEDDKEAVIKEYKRMLKSKEMEWKMGYRFLRADGSVANVLSSRIILRDVEGKAFRMIGAMQDISNQKVLEERLEHEIRLKEIQIAEAAEDAKHTERSDIGKELHDNVNQLLGASKLYLDMAKRGGENSEMYLSRSSEYTLTAIEEIRKLTKGLTTDIIKNLGLGIAIDNIIQDTMETTSLRIKCNISGFNESSVNDKFKLNVFRILQEQLNNIYKHAQASKVVITLLQNSKFIRLKIRDNGIGFDTQKKKKGIGLANIKSRATLYTGMADFISKPGKGCILTVTFPTADKNLLRA